ncbi:hypothetical protein KOW79_014581 [Hemibagrus wyckioides]|uniref:Uncharacterized protein n=1 Tax=Hemibagrus wyckioides TaxID=337641 RepID=A0A9D3SJG7_9TELE|nr:hypothetical protein KOW79_014581 [Hemibagrus wyckioides]
MKITALVLQQGLDPGSHGWTSWSLYTASVIKHVPLMSLFLGNVELAACSPDPRPISWEIDLCQKQSVKLHPGRRTHP